MSPAAPPPSSSASPSPDDRAVVAAGGGGGFAVIDVETTGFRAGGGDRVVEIAVVQVDLIDDDMARAWPVEGHAIGAEYVTLLDPGRDPGPTHVHGIRDEHLVDAPTFDEVAGDVSTLLEGRTIVAHNASFDLRFLAAEFDEAGHPLPALPYVCTLQMSAALGKRVPRTLTACCSHFGVPLVHAHSALDDARATARLFAACVAAGCGPERVLRSYATGSRRSTWPRIRAAGVAPRVRGQ